MIKPFSAVICLALSSFLQTNSLASDRSTADGVYTQSQSEAGKQAYQSACASCHDVKFYRDIWGYWQGKDLIDFYWRIVAEMPSDNPGSLSDSEYTDIIAYILSQLDYPTGDSPLDPFGGMDEISISSR